MFLGEKIKMSWSKKFTNRHGVKMWWETRGKTVHVCRIYLQLCNTWKDKETYTSCSFTAVSLLLWKRQDSKPSPLRDEAAWGQRSERFGSLTITDSVSGWQHRFWQNSHKRHLRLFLCNWDEKCARSEKRESEMISNEQLW